LVTTKGTEQHLDDYTAATSLSLPGFLHIPPPESTYMTQFSQYFTQTQEKNKAKTRKEKRKLTPSVNDMTLIATNSDVFKSLAL